MTRTDTLTFPGASPAETPRRSSLEWRRGAEGAATRSIAVLKPRAVVAKAIDDGSESRKLKAGSRT